MSKISPCLWFKNEAEEAAKFYVSLLPGSRIDRVQMCRDEPRSLGLDLGAAGNSVGTVSNIAITPRGLAELTLDITDSSYYPLRQGTEATVPKCSSIPLVRPCPSTTKVTWNPSPFFSENSVSLCATSSMGISPG